MISFAECTSNLYGTCLSVPHFNLSSSLLPYYNSSFLIALVLCIIYYIYISTDIYTTSLLHIDIYIYARSKTHWYILSTSEKCLIRLKIITSSSKSRIYLQIIHNIPLIYIHAHQSIYNTHHALTSASLERFNTIFITR